MSPRVAQSRNKCPGWSAKNREPKSTDSNDQQPAPKCRHRSRQQRPRNLRTDRTPQGNQSLLIEEARNHPDSQYPTEGGGRRWSATGADGCIARVNIPAPALKSKIEDEGKLIPRIRQLAGAAFGRLFGPVLVYKPITKFRDEAFTLLPRSDARKLIALCESESAPRVSFETADHSVVATVG